MKIVVIGLGSMGRRRARLLQSMGDHDVVGVDLDEERQDQARQELRIPTYGSLATAVAKESPDAAVISTSPLSHSAIVEECLKNDLHVFTELNLVTDGYEVNTSLAKARGLVWFPSSTFVYRREIESIQKLVGENPVGAWTYHVGQYLPDWHPWESYKNFFVADERTSGVRELLAIELPWLIKTFGPIEKTGHVSQKISDLDISYDDAIAVTIKHENGSVGTLLIDVVCRKAVRDFSFTSEDRYVEWDGSPTGVQYLDLDSHEMVKVDVYGSEGADQRSDYARFIVEDAYRAELAAFIDAIESGSTLKWSLEDDGAVLSLIDRLEQR